MTTAPFSVIPSGYVLIPEALFLRLLIARGHVTSELPETTDPSELEDELVSPPPSFDPRPQGVMVPRGLTPVGRLSKGVVPPNISETSPATEDLPS